MQKEFAFIPFNKKSQVTGTKRPISVVDNTESGYNENKKYKMSDNSRLYTQPTVSEKKTIYYINDDNDEDSDDENNHNLTHSIKTNMYKPSNSFNKSQTANNKPNNNNINNNNNRINYSIPNTFSRIEGRGISSPMFPIAGLDTDDARYTIPRSDGKLIGNESFDKWNPNIDLNRADPKVAELIKKMDESAYNPDWMKQYFMRKDILYKDPWYKFMYILCGALRMPNVSLMFEQEQFEQAATRAAQSMGMIKKELELKLIAAPEMSKILEDKSQRVTRLRLARTRLLSTVMPSIEPLQAVVQNIFDTENLCRDLYINYLAYAYKNHKDFIPYAGLNKILNELNINAIDIVGQRDEKYEDMIWKFNVSIIVVVLRAFDLLNKGDFSDKIIALGTSDFFLDIPKKNKDTVLFKLNYEKNRGLIKKNVKVFSNETISVEDTLVFLFEDDSIEDFDLKSNPLIKKIIENCKHMIRYDSIRGFVLGPDMPNDSARQFLYDKWYTNMESLITYVANMLSYSCLQSSPPINLSFENANSELRLINKLPADSEDLDVLLEKKDEEIDDIRNTLPFLTHSIKLDNEEQRSIFQVLYKYTFGLFKGSNARVGTAGYFATWKNIADGFYVNFPQDYSILDLIDPDSIIYDVVSSGYPIDDMYTMIIDRFNLSHEEFKDTDEWKKLPISIKMYVDCVYIKSIEQMHPQIIDPKIFLVIKLCKYEVIRYFLQRESESKMIKIEKEKNELDKRYSDIISGDEYDKMRKSIVDGRPYEKILSYVTRPENIGKITISPDIFYGVNSAWSNLCEYCEEFDRIDLEDLIRFGDDEVLTDFAGFVKAYIVREHITIPNMWNGENHPKQAALDYMNKLGTMKLYHICERNRKLCFSKPRR
jgi:hypothetical protein